MDQNEVDEFLEHHGVKGMHWGVRRSKSAGASPSPSNEEIHAARAAQFQRRADYHKAKASGNVDAVAKAAKDFNTSKDRAVAAHLTRGEKVATVLLSGVQASSIGTVRANAAVNLTGKSVAGHLLLDNNLGPFAIARAGHQAKKLSSG